jgi:lysophospholipase L1-like esterase
VAIGVVSVLPGSLPRRIYHDVRNELCRKGPTDHATVALGDSLTRMNSDPGWNFLGTSWFAIDSCDGRMAYGYHAGVYGNTTAQMLARFPTDLAARHPKEVIILGGTNDVLQHVPAPVTISHLRQLIEESRVLGASVAVGTIPPIDSGPFTDAVDGLNARIATLAAATHSTLIDFHAAVAEGDAYRPGWTVDGVHPTLRGAEAMASAAVAAIDPRPR